MFVIAIRLRGDHRTPLTSWRLHMCTKLLGILAVSVGILPRPCQFLLESSPQHAIALAKCNAKKLCASHQKMSQNINIHQWLKNASRSKKLFQRPRKTCKKRLYKDFGFCCVSRSSANAWFFYVAPGNMIATVCGMTLESIHAIIVKRPWLWASGPTNENWHHWCF